MKIAILATALLIATGAWAQTQTPPAKGKGERAARVAKKKAEAPPPPVVLPTLTEEHQAVARQVHTGAIACEMGQNVTVEADAANPGFFFVTAKGQRYHMAPGLSRIGAVRLEDVRGGALWLQIANKSMLMNTRLGQRIADECMSEHQSVVAAEMKKNPPRSLLD